MIQNPTKSFTIFSFLLGFIITTAQYPTVMNAENYVEEACKVTRYQDLCIKSLASYSNKAKKSPHKWARVGVSVTISEVKYVSKYLYKVKIRNHVKGKKVRTALSDCVECIQDTLDNLYKSLSVLRRLSFGEFNDQVGDVLTWLSAALTDEDTCLNGFDGAKIRNKSIVKVCNKVQNVSYITSNALALVNKLASAGLEDLDARHL
ncbi:pectinesterase inhibitor 6 [Amaranthus tricolor]|uniref:pectinesterase inhibitor 6 n=1 Tax=Amaranthus tricolor TaxID=29722 RepID=UPI002589AB99|nr:pectinesterase inhibitor 6 [Amaranthus tricolor]